MCLASVFRTFAYISGAKLREGWKSPPGPHGHCGPTSDTRQLLKGRWNKGKGRGGWCQVGRGRWRKWRECDSTGRRGAREALIRGPPSDGGLRHYLTSFSTQALRVRITLRIDDNRHPHPGKSFHFYFVAFVYLVSFHLGRRGTCSTRTNTQQAADAQEIVAGRMTKDWRK